MGIVNEIEVLPTGENDRPLQEVRIEDCGQLEQGGQLGICEDDGTEDVFPFHPEDVDMDWYACRTSSDMITLMIAKIKNYRYLVENFPKVLDMVNKIKSSGNHHFKKKDLRTAARKYRKALKYINLLRESMGSTRWELQLNFLHDENR